VSDEQERSGSRVMVAVGERGHLEPLLAVGCALAGARDGRVVVLSVTPDGQRPSWLTLPERCGEVEVEVQVRAGAKPGVAIARSLLLDPPDALLLGWEGDAGRGRYLLGSTLDPVLQRAPCDVMVVRITPEDEAQGEPPTTERLAKRLAATKRILVPAAGGPNAALAIRQGLDLAPEAQVTALYVARRSLGPGAVALGRERLRQTLEPWADNERVRPLVVQSDDIVAGILQEAERHDLLYVGASEESLVGRALFGNIPQRVAAESPTPVIVVRHGAGRVGSLLRQVRWGLFEALPKVDVSERAEIYLDIWRGARPRVDFYVMIGLAAAIAALGLLLNSPAVIIGAMLVAPLMAAVIALGLGVVQGDARLLRVAIRSVVRGAVLAIAVGLLMSLAGSGRAPTAEMLSRAQPSLLDLAVALASGAAGAYALSRKDVSASLPGVAIAAALVPPLATVGLGLGMGQLAMAGGALLLFATNLVAISAAGGLIFLWLGFAPEPEENKRQVFRSGVWGAAILLGVISIILGWLSVDSLRAAKLDRGVQAAIVAELGALGEVELVSWEVEAAESAALHLDMTVKSAGEIDPAGAAAFQREVAARLGRPVGLTLSTVPTQHLAPVLPPAPRP